ncbi:MAG: hypothetical protein R3E45_07180 [Rhodocyclaceae bacterium]
MDLSIGQEILPEQIRMIEWPSGSVPTAFAQADALKDRVTRTSVLRDEPILESKLAPVGTRSGLSAIT